MSLSPLRTRITLYGVADTPYTEKVVRALRLKGLDHRLVEPQSREDYRRWSPETGLLPVMELGGVRVQDSSRILDRIEERFPHPPLLAADPKVAREQRRIEEWVGETFSFYVLRWLQARTGRRIVPQELGRGVGPMARLGLLGPDGRVAPEFFDTRDGGPGPEFDRRLDDLEQLLGDRPYFYAERLSRADLAVFAGVYSMYTNRYPGGRALLAARRRLFAHSGRVDSATRQPACAAAPESSGAA